MVEVAMLKCVTILNVLLLAVGTNAFGQDQSPSSDVPKNQGIWDYVVMDVTTYPAWNGATVALLADVTNQPQNIAAPTSELLANPRMFNVCGGAKSRQNPNSFTV